jgi:hypothetical protein
MLVKFDVSGGLAILALIRFKLTYAIQDKTAASSLLVVKPGLGFKAPFPQIFLEKFEQLQLARRVSAKDGSQ